MKIIGTGLGDKLLIEATPQEIAHIEGFSGTYERERLTSRGWRVGQEIPVVELWTLLQRIRRASSDLQGAAATITTVGSLLGRTPDILDELVTGKKTEKTEEGGE